MNGARLDGRLALETGRSQSLPRPPTEGASPHLYQESGTVEPERLLSRGHESRLLCLGDAVRTTPSSHENMV